MLIKALLFYWIILRIPFFITQIKISQIDLYSRRIYSHTSYICVYVYTHIYTHTQSHTQYTLYIICTKHIIHKSPFENTRHSSKPLWNTQWESNQDYRLEFDVSMEEYSGIPLLQILVKLKPVSWWSTIETISLLQC